MWPDVLRPGVAGHYSYWGRGVEMELSSVNLAELIKNRPVARRQIRTFSPLPI